MAFPRGRDKIKYWKRKPQAYTLEKALETLQTMLATQDINLMIDWAYGKYNLPPPAYNYAVAKDSVDINFQEAMQTEDSDYIKRCMKMEDDKK